ncbi:MAG: hypothetical protein WD690_08970 [Vicinamibacterales bacterium]
MPSRAQRILKWIVPPILWSIGIDFKNRFWSPHYLAYAPGGWSTRLPPGSTSERFWDNVIAEERPACESLKARVKAGAPMLPLERDVEDVFFGYVLALAARNTSSLTVLDYGGNLGRHYWLAIAFVPLVDLTYHCKELPGAIAAGRQMTPDAAWHTDDTCLDQSYDLVMFCSSLQYLPNWRDVLRRGAQAARSYLLLSDVPTVRTVPGYGVAQRRGGLTNLQHELNRSEVVDTVERAGLRLVREVDLGVYPPVANAPEQPRCTGFLFERATATESSA